MNKLTAGLTVLCLALVLGLALLLARDGDPAVPNPVPESHVEKAEPAQSRSAALEASPVALEAETEIVMGLKVRKDRNCTVTKHMLDLGDGLVTEAYRCDSPDVEDPYAAYSDADLSVLSYSDPGAAAELGKRLLYQRRQGPANELMLRAVALEPNDVKPLLYLMSQTGSLRGDSPAARKAVADAYVISRTAGYFDPDVSVHWLAEDLREYRFLPEDIEQLDSIVANNLRRMRDTQIEVFGESRIGDIGNGDIGNGDMGIGDIGSGEIRPGATRVGEER